MADGRRPLAFLAELLQLLCIARSSLVATTTSAATYIVSTATIALRGRSIDNQQTTQVLMMGRRRCITEVLLAAVLVAAASGGLLVAAAKDDDFSVDGSVYCDTCRAGFETKATTPIAGAKVRLECRHFMSASGAVERSAEGTTDAAGRYSIRLVDNRGAEEVCSVVLVSSPVPGCAEKEAGRDRAQVELVTDAGAGLTTTVRRANALGFLKSQPLPNCAKILSSYGLGGT